MNPNPKSLDEIRRSVTTVPWRKLAHAYHGAWDAPEMLEVFLDVDSSQEALDKAVSWMWGSILHQGSIYSASTPVIWILIDLIGSWPGHPRAVSILYAMQTITDGLLYFGDGEDSREPVLQNAPDEPVYEAWTDKDLAKNSDDAVDTDAYFDACYPSARQLRALVRHAIPVIAYFLEHTQGDTRTAAVAAGLGALEVVPDAAEPLANLIDVIGDAGYDAGAWVSVAMVFGKLGRDMTGFLEHKDRRVRLAAAMSCATEQDARSVTELASALSEPEWLEQSFPDGAANLDMHLRFHVLGALLDRADPAAVPFSAVKALCTLIHERSNRHTVDYEWGRILQWAFKERKIQLPHEGKHTPLPKALTPTQAAILQTLCAKEQLWDPTNGNASLAFMRVQLPYDRKTMSQLVNQLS